MSRNPPQWDLKAWFEDFSSSDYSSALAACETALTQLTHRCEQLDRLTVDSAESWADILSGLEELGARLGHLRGYVGCRNAADTTDLQAQKQSAQISGVSARCASLHARLVHVTGSADEESFQALLDHPAMHDLGFRLQRLRASFERQMPVLQESLANDLAVDGILAWGRLYQDLTGNLEFTLDDGRQVPFAWRRSLLQSSDPAVRASAFQQSNAVLSQHGRVLSGVLNAIAGTRLSLRRWRSTPSVLDEALFDACLSRATLDTMLGAIRRRRDIPRRFLKLKARLHGVDQLGFADLEAPTPLGPPLQLSWEDAQTLVLDAFESHHPELAAFARLMLDANRVEASARTGKRAGAFCTSSKVDRASWVFMTFRETMGDVRTLAHELGHAFHNHSLRALRPWAGKYPMTLAESASIFTESLVSDKLLRDPSLSIAQRAQILDGRLQRASTYLLNIPMRFEFESAFYERRKDGEVAVEELCALVSHTQREVYGDALDPSQTDPWFWASKLHFFLPSTRFYNFPYTFGYLFSLGLHARSQAAGSVAYHPVWVKLLRETGQGSVEEIAQRILGVDLEQPGFWEASIDRVEQDLKLFEELVEQL